MFETSKRRWFIGQAIAIVFGIVGMYFTRKQLDIMAENIPLVPNRMCLTCGAIVSAMDERHADWHRNGTP